MRREPRRNVKILTCLGHCTNLLHTNLSQSGQFNESLRGHVRIAPFECSPKRLRRIGWRGGQVIQTGRQDDS